MLACFAAWPAQMGSLNIELATGKEEHLVKPAKEMSQRQVVVSAGLPVPQVVRLKNLTGAEASVGLWGGVFPVPRSPFSPGPGEIFQGNWAEVPPCTMPATLLCVLVYSAGVPKVQRFSVPCKSQSFSSEHLL